MGLLACWRACCYPPAPFDETYNELPPPFDAQVDAAACVDNERRHLVLFSDGQVLTYSAWIYAHHGRRVIEAPCSTKDHPIFGELPAPFDTKIEAACCVNSRRMHFLLFSRGQVMLYNAAKRTKRSRIIEVPRATQGDRVFGDLPEPFASNISAAVCVHEGSRRLILFSSGQMMKYGATTRQREARVIKSPRPTKRDPVYQELPRPFSANIDAAVCLNPNSRHFVLFSDGQVMQFCSWSYKQAGERVVERPIPTAHIVGAV
jgi:hypothetical protein